MVFSHAEAGGDRMDQLCNKNVHPVKRRRKGMLRQIHRWALEPGFPVKRKMRAEDIDHAHCNKALP